MLDGENAITGAQLSANFRDNNGKSMELAETEPGLYSVEVNTSKISGMATLIVEAKGNTKSGLQFLRQGSIELIAGDSHAKILNIGKEQVTNTDLVVEVNIQVSAPGRYYVHGNLLSASGEPIAWAQDAREIQPGRSTFTLRFARELINQSGQSSGFKLSDVELMNTTAMPGVKAPNKITDFFLKSSL